MANNKLESEQEILSEIYQRDLGILGGFTQLDLHSQNSQNLDNTALIKLFKIIRIPVLPLPLLLWTVLLLIIFISTIALSIISIPIFFVGTSVYHIVGYPFVFIYTAFTNNIDSLSKYSKQWTNSYHYMSDLILLYKKIPTLSVYKSIFKWWKDPRTIKGGTAVILSTNVLSIIIITIFLPLIMRSFMDALIVFIGIAVFVFLIFIFEDSY